MMSMEKVKDNILRSSVWSSACWSLRYRAQPWSWRRRQSAWSQSVLQRRCRSCVGDTCILIVAAGDARVDNKKYKERFGAKAKMLAHDDVPEYIGHAVGGVCPFAVKEGVKVYLDESLKRFETVFPAAGSANSAIELTIPELEQYSKFDGWVDVCKDWRTDAEG